MLAARSVHGRRRASDFGGALGCRDVGLMAGNVYIWLAAIQRVYGNGPLEDASERWSAREMRRQVDKRRIDKRQAAVIARGEQSGAKAEWAQTSRICGFGRC